ncbi:hypothetical protein J1605_019549 [Eschrichtius robustus]|uniref:Uncharacterized protein n=1 Tax=Eschrichtius robustus TaxID=9764 RepID=A0AB34HMD6_ESCRO|nr:hypothetical protein J1605_019549 [Eschrichtius robustus]
MRWGDYDQSRTKVLHLSLNPAGAARQRLHEDRQQLREECERLRELVRALEAGGAVPTDLEAAAGLPSSREVAGICASPIAGVVDVAPLRPICFYRLPHVEPAFLEVPEDPRPSVLCETGFVHRRGFSCDPTKQSPPCRSDWRYRLPGCPRGGSAAKPRLSRKDCRDGGAGGRCPALPVALCSALGTQLLGASQGRRDTCPQALWASRQRRPVGPSSLRPHSKRDNGKPLESGQSVGGWSNGGQQAPQEHVGHAGPRAPSQACGVRTRGGRRSDSGSWFCGQPTSSPMSVSCGSGDAALALEGRGHCSRSPEEPGGSPGPAPALQQARKGSPRAPSQEAAGGSSGRNRPASRGIVAQALACRVPRVPGPTALATRSRRPARGAHLTPPVYVCCHHRASRTLLLSASGAAEARGAGHSPQLRVNPAPGSRESGQVPRWWLLSARETDAGGAAVAESVAGLWTEREAQFGKLPPRAPRICLSAQGSSSGARLPGCELVAFKPGLQKAPGGRVGGRALRGGVSTELGGRDGAAPGAGDGGCPASADPDRSLEEGRRGPSLEPVRSAGGRAPLQQLRCLGFVLVLLLSPDGGFPPSRVSWRRPGRARTGRGPAGLSGCGAWRAGLSESLLSPGPP